MAIEKITMNYLKQVKLPFTCVFNETMEAIKDPIALSIYIYLLSKPDNWIIRHQDIMNRFNIGKESVFKRLKILKNLGLVKKESIRDEKGVIKYWESIILLQIPENPESGQSRIWQTDTLNKERDLVKKELITTSEANASKVVVNEVVDACNELCPELPKIIKIDDKLKNMILKMQKEWPSYSGEQFTVDSWKEFLVAMKNMESWFFKKWQTKSGNWKRNTLRTLVDPTMLAKLRNNEFN